MPQPTKTTAEEPYEQTIPGGRLDSLESACAWVSTVVRSFTDQNDLPHLAARNARNLIANALRATPTADKVRVKVSPLANHLKIEVRHPGRPFALLSNWEGLTTEISDFGTSGSPSGHVAWFLVSRRA
ncbi:ATP-binding protein [Microbispora amethystogenes]|uniref:ATP-binding protein n=1 Tax=Microbispora amethystogenes TaxID=1427754 RepID=UPI0033F353F0